MSEGKRNPAWLCGRPCRSCRQMPCWWCLGGVLGFYASLGNAASDYAISAASTLTTRNVQANSSWSSCGFFFSRKVLPLLEASTISLTSFPSLEASSNARSSRAVESSSAAPEKRILEPRGLVAVDAGNLALPLVDLPVEVDRFEVD